MVCKVPVQSLIDHIKTSMDVDPWAKEMAEELLKKYEPVYPTWQQGKMYCGSCGVRFPKKINIRFCYRCGTPVRLQLMDEFYADAERSGDS